ncbi:MAG: hypothetical protein JWL59_2049 [Chthoniobacteraceae bacterium]|nr:hypothetical protein [Chthoniobacteraceae bacterium]
MNNRKPHPQALAGAALIWALLVCGLLTVLVLGLLTAITSERRLSHGETEIGAADLLIEGALAEVRGKLATGFDAETPGADGLLKASVTASPGLMEVRHYGFPYNRGSASGPAAFDQKELSSFSRPFAAHYDGSPANPRWIPLFSWKYFAPTLRNLTQTLGRPGDLNSDFNPAAVFNLNTPNNPFSPGYCYLSGVGGDPAGVRYEKDVQGHWATAGAREKFALFPGETSAERPVWVQWIPILQDPAKPPGNKNRMIGRYAYWVDVENTKLHLERATRPLRQHEVFARFLGEGDAAAGSGGYFSQSGGNPFSALRLRAEGAVAHWDKSSRRSLDGQPGPGFSGSVGAEARDAWLDWRNGERPAAADTSLVDWDFFAALRPRGTAEKMALDGILGEHARRVTQEAAVPFNSPWEAFMLLDPKLRKESSSTVDIRADLMRQMLTSSATIWGHDEERDPLGRPKIDLPKFQCQISGTAGANIEKITQSTLWMRLHDARYFSAYYPAAFPTNGQPRSFIQSFNRFAGDGSSSRDANGEAAVLQMLANIGEYAQPASTAPLIDRERGIVGGRSMPYVAEVATRARSAWWLLPPAARANPSAFFQTNGSANDGGNSLAWYASHLIIDLTIGCINPNPFETRPFDGELELDADWHDIPPGSQIESGPFRAGLKGLFTTSPESGKAPKRVRLLGKTVTFRLGVVPASALLDPAFATAFRIKGWRVRSGNQVWHEVPVRHPGAKETREWWAMAQPGENAGSPWDSRSLAAYQFKPETYGYRAVGWFTKPSLDMLMPDTLFVAGLDPTRPLTSALSSRLATWLQWTPMTSMVERVFSVDPVLGHRTGDPTLHGIWGKGHFYGALGHPWRRLSQRPAYQSIKSGQTMPEIRELAIQECDYTLGNRIEAGIAGKIGRGAFLDSGQHPASVLPVTAHPGKVYSGKYFSHYWLYPTEKQDTTISAPDSPTGLFLVPSIEGSFPLGDLDAEHWLDTTVQLESAESGRVWKDADLETAEPLIDKGDLTALPESKKSSRSLFCQAPASRPMTSLGELGFCHSGFFNRPILIGPEEGRTDVQLNSPRHGPPMRMLLDLFNPAVFADPDTGSPLSAAAWAAGNYRSASPEHPRRGLWSVNTAIAHDGYMALREGGTANDWNLKTLVEPTYLPAHVVWLPNARGHARRQLGAENFHGKELGDLFSTNVGHILDRHLSPFPAFDRPWEMWLGMIGGDFSATRASGGQMWGINNALRIFYGPGSFTWCPGKGLGLRAPYYSNPFVDFEPSATHRGKLLVFGNDGRDDTTNTGDGWLRGRCAADQNLDSLKAGRLTYLPAHHVTRLSLFPIRHFISDLSVDYQVDGEFHYLKSPLNPRQNSAPPPSDNSSALNVEGGSFPGGCHMTGVFYHAPLALLLNQATTAANAFTAHIVVQSMRDLGKKRETIEKSGYGFSDSDDEVLCERWARVVLASSPDHSEVPEPRKLRVVSFEKAGR